VKLWAEVRGGWAVPATVLATIGMLLLPASAISVTPSPAGATIAAAALLALAVPVVCGWACARGDAALESVAQRGVRGFDLGLVLIATFLSAAAALLLAQAGAAPAGVIEARAAFAFVGLLVAAEPWLGWQKAATVPVVYFLAVVLLGGGSDSRRPAAWAWIAAPDRDLWSWLASAAVVFIGVAAYLRVRRPAALGDRA